jgi:PTS system nitrogen regulatory IIA component
MEIADLITPAAVVAHLKAANKKQALQELASKAAKVSGLPERRIFETLSEREKLGSTGMGQGVAIPHGRFAGIDRMAGLFARLDSPIEFEAMDDQPVDLMFVLMAPEGAGADHLKALARVSRLLRNHAVVEKLRAAKDPAALYALLTEPSASAHAA